MVFVEFAHLFVKAPWLGDSEGTFESSFHLLQPVYWLKGRDNTVKCLAQGHNLLTYLHIIPLNAERQAMNTNFLVF